MAIIVGNNLPNNLPGTASPDTIVGRAGNDRLFGNGGNDRLNGGTQNDLLNGGAGIDTADYSNIVIGGTTYIGATAGVRVNLGLAGAQNTVGTGTDTLVSIENLIGTSFNDVLTGNAGNNMLDGLAGNDTLNGGSGNDQLYGRSGNDQLNGGNGNDTVNGGTGNDRLNGGAGIDTASYTTATAGVTVDLGLTGTQNTGGAGTDTLVSIENLTGSNFNDTLKGDSLDNNTLNGEAGDDTLNVTFSYNSTLNGGAGNDQLTFDHSTAMTLNGEAGNDQLICAEGAGTLNGGAGNDQLAAGDGSFTLNGGDGNDMLDAMGVGAWTIATLNGGAGADTLYSTGTPDIGMDTGIVTFDYNAVSDSPAGAGKDIIIGFTGSGGELDDRIDLATIDANVLVAGNQAFSYIGGAAFTAAGQLRYAGGVLSGNTDGDAAAEFQIQLVGAPALVVGGAGTDILL